MSSKQYFETVAAQWDRLRSSFFPESIREQALTAASVTAGAVAADLGAGTGFITEELLKRGVRVIAVDQAQNMLDQMKAKFGPEAAVEYRQGDAERLPIETESLDYAFANMYLHHVDNPPLAIREMVRILKPGGRLVITDLDEHRFEFLVTEQHDRWMGFKREDVRRWFQEAGLQDVRVESAQATCCADSDCTTERAEVGVFLAIGTKSRQMTDQKNTDERAINKPQESSGAPCCDLTLREQEEPFVAHTIRPTTQESPSKIKQLVREEYTKIAQQDGTKSCCSTSCCGDENVAVMADEYSRFEGYVPEADLGLGCGTPVEFARIKPGETVLDLGSGAGNDAFIVRSLVGETGKVIGVDLTEAMIMKARQNNAKLGFQNVEFVLGDIELLPLPSESVEVVLSNCVLNLVPHKARAFSEIYRVLKPGGRFSISDIVATGELPEKIRTAAELYVGCVSGAIRKEDYLSIISKTGFRNVAVLREKRVNIPQETLGRYLDVSEHASELHSVQEFGVPIVSITVYGEKPVEP
jgi:ubiquinone/menaquinone biosynthesis C-methylase UbiE